MTPGPGGGPGSISYKVSGSNLAKGANIISFTSRTYICDTFHHAVLYNIPEVNACYIIDSWSADQGRSCRPLSSRLHPAHEVYAIIDELNSDVITEARTNEILTTYFRGHIDTVGKVLKITGRIRVHTINPLYIQHIYNECKRRLESGEQQVTAFGGKRRNKSKNKSRKRSKKYSRRSNRKHKIYSHSSNSL